MPAGLPRPLLGPQTPRWPPTLLLELRSLRPQPAEMGWAVARMAVLPSPPTLLLEPRSPLPQPAAERARRTAAPAPRPSPPTLLLEPRSRLPPPAAEMGWAVARMAALPSPPTLLLEPRSPLSPPAVLEPGVGRPAVLPSRPTLLLEPRSRLPPPAAERARWTAASAPLPCPPTLPPAPPLRRSPEMRTATGWSTLPTPESWVTRTETAWWTPKTLVWSGTPTVSSRCWVRPLKIGDQGLKLPSHALCAHEHRQQLSLNVKSLKRFLESHAPSSPPLTPHADHTFQATALWTLRTQSSAATRTRTGWWTSSTVSPQRVNAPWWVVVWPPSRPNSATGRTSLAGENSGERPNHVISR